MNSHSLSQANSRTKYRPPQNPSSYKKLPPPNRTFSPFHPSIQSNYQEQEATESISPLAIRNINQEIYSILQMDPYNLEFYLRKADKSIHGLVNNDLLSSIKHLSPMKLLLYRLMFMYIKESSRRISQKSRSRQRQMDDSRERNCQRKPSSFNEQTSISSQTHKYPDIPHPSSSQHIFSQQKIQHIQLKIDKIQRALNSLSTRAEKIPTDYYLSEEDLKMLKTCQYELFKLKQTSFSPVLKQTSDSIPSRTPKLDNIQVQSQINLSRQRNMSRNSSRSKTFQVSTGQQPEISDEEGNRLLISQLEQIIQRKENRIKELTKEMTFNLHEHQELQNTVQNLEKQISQLTQERQSSERMLEKIQEENLNYQLELKELRQLYQRQRASLLVTDPSESQRPSISIQLPLLRQEQQKQEIKTAIGQEKKAKLTLSGILLQMAVQSKLSLQERQKQSNSLSGSQGTPQALNAIGINDISQITPRRLLKKMLPSDLVNDEPDYEMEIEEDVQNNAITVRKNTTPPHPPSRNSNSRLKYIGSKTQNKSEKGQPLIRVEDRESYEKFLLLQALTIEQMLEDI